MIILENALIVSYNEQGIDNISNLLKMLSCKKISIAKTCGDARRLANEKAFDLYIINSPVHNETGEELAKELINNDCSQVVLLVKNDIFNYVSNQVEDYGIITISKPVNKGMLWSALKLAKASYGRLKNMKKKNDKLTQTIDDIKIVNRAKFILISHLNMSEVEAHKFIEKKAMDTRLSRRDVARSILRTYEN